MYVSRLLDEKQYLKAFEFIHKYKNYDTTGQLNYTLALMNKNPEQYGNVTEKNRNLAFKEFEIAASKNHSLAEYSLGICYIAGLGIETDKNKGLSLIESSASKGCLPSIKLMHQILSEGRISASDAPLFPKNLDEAFKYLNLAAECHDPNSIYLLGHAYEEGVGCTKNFDKALEIYNQAVQMGSPAAMRRLGNFHISVEANQMKNQEIAFQYYNLASFLGDEESILKGSRMLIAKLQNNFNAFETKITKAHSHLSEDQKLFVTCIFKNTEPKTHDVHLYQKLIGLGKSTNLFTVIELIKLLFQYGQENKITTEIAQNLYLLTEQATQKKVDFSLTDPYYYLGICFYKGFGAKVDLPLALKFLGEAYKLNHPEAQGPYMQLKKMLDRRSN